jgi:hypothetical protein
MPKLRTWQWAVIAVAALIGIILLSGCEAVDERPCAKGHTESYVTSEYAMGYDGKMHLVMVTKERFVCDEYVPTSSPS